MQQRLVWKIFSDSKNYLILGLLYGAATRRTSLSSFWAPGAVQDLQYRSQDPGLLGADWFFWGLTKCHPPEPSVMAKARRGASSLLHFLANGPLEIWRKNLRTFRSRNIMCFLSLLNVLDRVYHPPSELIVGAAVRSLMGARIPTKGKHASWRRHKRIPKQQPHR